MPWEQGLKELCGTPTTLPHPCTQPRSEAVHPRSQPSAWGGKAGPMELARFLFQQVSVCARVHSASFSVVSRNSDNCLDF